MIEAFNDLKDALGDRLGFGSLNGDQPTVLDHTQYCFNTCKLLVRIFGGTDGSLNLRLGQLDITQAQQRLPLRTFLLSFISAAGIEWVLGKSLKGYQENLFTKKLRIQLGKCT